MIRGRRVTAALLNAWLVAQAVPASIHPRYGLRLWRDAGGAFTAAVPEMRAYIDEAFEDAKRKLRSGFQDPLSPFTDPATDPAANFPAMLHRVTLQGYLGETLGVLAVEHWGAHGHMDWRVPALLFRFHEAEFQHLELINQRIRDGEAHDRDAPREQRPGRTGDDGLAFRIDGRNNITDVLTLEAKCVGANRTTIVEEAHDKLARGAPLPSGVRELIEILADYDTPEANRWREALLRLRTDGYRTATRHDGVVYACGALPAASRTRVAWLRHDRPHAAYTADRNLAAMEFQFADLDAVVDALYL